MLTVLETTVRHASDSLELVEGSGLVQRRETVEDNGVATVVPTNTPAASLPVVPEIELTSPPPDLVTVKRPGRVILWRQTPRDLNRTVYGRADEAQMTRPAEAVYDLEGQITFRSARYNPRLFKATAGGVSRPSVAVFQAAAAVLGDSSGVVTASLRFLDGRPASWAVVTARLDLPVANPAHTADRTYRAQADRRGELRLALTGLPAPTRAMAEANALNRVLTLSVTADPDHSDAEIADPDSFATMQLRGPDSTQFAADARFTIRPGGLIRITSQDSDKHLFLRPIP